MILMKAFNLEKEKCRKSYATCTENQFFLIFAQHFPTIESFKFRLSGDFQRFSSLNWSDSYDSQFWVDHNFFETKPSSENSAEVNNEVNELPQLLLINCNMFADSTSSTRRWILKFVWLSSGANKTAISTRGANYLRWHWRSQIKGS